LVPFVLIAIGLVALLSNAGLVSPDALDRALNLWPLILVLIGIEIILRRSQLSPDRAGQLGLLFLAILVAVVVVYSVAGPRRAAGGTASHAQADIGELTHAKLDLSVGGAGIDVHGGAGGEQLYRADFTYPASDGPPQTTLDRSNGALEISLPGDGLRLLGPTSGARHVTIGLTPRIPWAISLNGGASEGSLELSELQLSGLEVSGGADHLDISLPRPRGTVSLDFSGGAFDITLHVPSGIAEKATASGGANDVEIAGHHLGALGSDTFQTDNYDGATDRYEIDVSGGASHVRVAAG